MKCECGGELGAELYRQCSACGWVRVEPEPSITLSDLKIMDGFEKWKADTAPTEEWKARFLARAEMLEQIIWELEEGKCAGES